MHFIDLQVQYQAYRKSINDAVQEVMDACQFINGPQVEKLERMLAHFVDVEYAVGFSSGTDSLRAVLMAWEVGPGDEVITTPFSFIATAEVIAILGAVPVFVDVEPDTLNLDPAKLKKAIRKRTRAIMPVSLFGQCADFDAINEIAEKEGLPCLEDGCQSFGALYKGRRSGGLTTAAATSFFPAKPLGCFGDGGMAFTNDENLHERLKIIREHGQADRYRHAMVGMNGRLDTIQAAVLLAKMNHFLDEIEARQRVADYYHQSLKDLVRLPSIRPTNTSVYSQFTIRLPDRDRIREQMAAQGVPTAVHYPVCLHRQPVFAHLDHDDKDFPVATRAAEEVLSLPMHPFLHREQQDRVIQALIRAMT